MRLENLKRDFPVMPEELREMVEREVEKQVGATTKTGRRTHMVRKSLVAALAAAMLIGTTVFAGVIYQMHLESVGTYGIRTQWKEKESENGTKTGDSSIDEIYDIPAVKMEVSYLPDGMVEAEDGKYCYANAMYKGGVSILFYGMDTKEAQFDMLTTNVINSETIRVGAYDGVYLKLQSGSEDEISFDQRIYVAYTDLHYIMEMYIASDVSKKDALKIAEGIRLSVVSDLAADNETDGVISYYAWSDYLASRNKGVIETEPKLAAEKVELRNTHAIGEAFLAGTAEYDSFGLDQVEITVTDVQVLDHVHSLNLSIMDEGSREEIAKETDENGKLLPAKIQYIKYGDGIHTLNEMVESREVPQKLVYATVEYTNIGEEDLSDVLFFGEIVKMEEDGGQVKIYERGKTENDSAWDAAQIAGIARYQEMWYYDKHGGERGNNYIANLKAGETETIHMAWVVPEEELEYLYLSFDTFGGGGALKEHALAIGYVDIRQR